MVVMLDNGVGGILDELERHGLREKTLIIYSSDNGGSERSGQLNGIYRGGKFSMLEGGIRDPMLISWPSVLPENRVYGHPVINLDFFPTILSAANLAPAQECDGVNLLPYLTGKTKGTPHEMLFWKMPSDVGGYAVRAGDWKLLKCRLGRGLFNLKDDPGETLDLSAKFPEAPICSENGE